jgi:hypothetical protein
MTQIDLCNNFIYYFSYFKFDFNMGIIMIFLIVKYQLYIDHVVLNDLFHIHQPWWLQNVLMKCMYMYVCRVTYGHK